MGARLVLLVLLIAHGSVWAAKVVSARPGNDRHTHVRFAHYGQVYYHWVVNDVVCLVKPSDSGIICGRVEQYDKVETVLKIPNAMAQFSVGEEVRILYSKVRRVPGSTTTETVGSMALPHEDTKVLLGIGLGTGFSYLVLIGNVQFGLGQKFALGLLPTYAKEGGSDYTSSALGVFLTGTYYLFQKFSGYNVELGLGKYMLSVDDLITTPATTTSQSPFAFYTTFGWRGKINRGRFLMGVAGGFKYVGGSEAAIDFQGLMPLVALTAGVEF
jgi:hypothetical protein